MTIAIAIFFFAVTAIFYVLAVYPIALARYSRLAAQELRETDVRDRSITIVIPVRNGALWIAQKLNSLNSLKYPVSLLQILVISDGSTDETVALTKRYEGQIPVRVIELPPQGKAMALNFGLAEVSTEIVVLTDVRQPFDPSAVALLNARFADPAVGVVTGELVIRAGATSEEHNTGLYWTYEKWIRKNLNRIDAMLGATGAIYAIRRELVRKLPGDTLLDDVYLPMAAALHGNRIYFECNAKAYDFPTSLQSEFRRKVRTQAGVYQIARQFPSLLWPGNRRFIHFLSHKLGRLALPFCFIAVALSGFFLPQPLKAIVLLAQLFFYGSAVADTFIPEGFPFKKLTAVIRAFLVLVTAALYATSILFVPAQKLWKDTRVSLPGSGLS